MGVTALALGGWISVYCGVSLLRSNLPEMNSEPQNSRKKLAIAGCVFVILGLVVLARAFLPRIH